VVSAAFDSMAASCRSMVAVMGHDAPAVEAALRPREFMSVRADPDAPMFESVRVGVRAAMAAHAQWIVLLPGDHPAVRRETTAMLLEHARRNDRFVIVPEYGGRGGHPVIVPAVVVPMILSHDGADGLSGVWRTNPHVCLRVVVNDPGVVRDLDTPEEYARTVND